MSQVLVLRHQKGASGAAVKMFRHLVVAAFYRRRSKMMRGAAKDLPASFAL